MVGLIKSRRKWIGLVCSHDTDFEDYNVNFVHPSGLSNFYHYPEVKDCCNIEKKDIIKILSPPSLKAGTTRIQYSFAKEELKQMD